MASRKTPLSGGSGEVTLIATMSGNPTRRALLSALLLAAAVLVTVDPGPAVAQYPGRNGKIAFVRGAPGQQDIFIMSSAGTDLENLTEAPGSYGDIDWAADGSKMAFTQLFNGANEVWVMNADGTGKRRVTAAGVTRDNPSWSPDGTQLAVDGEGRIYSIHLATGTETLIKDQEEYATYCDGNYTVNEMFSNPQWSPVDQLLAVSVSREFPPIEGAGGCESNPNIKIDLGIMSTAGGGVSKLTDDNQPDFLPDFSPDGRTIVYQRGSSGVFAIPTSGAGGSMLSEVGGRPRWTPDGERIMYVRDQDLDGNLELWIMNPDGTEREPLLQDGASNGQADWQPLPGCALTLGAPRGRTAAGTCPFVVNSTTDRSDKKPGNKRCDTGKLIDGEPECTLRAAIQEANATDAKDEIHFNIDGTPSILPKSELPIISRPVKLDGSTQPGTSPGASGIFLDGSSAGESSGLTVGGKNTTIIGLAIGNFSFAGILLKGNNAIVVGNHIGTDAAGLAAAPNRFGVMLDSSGNNTIGGETPELRNVISGNTGGGVFLTSSSNKNAIAGNYIGVDAAAEHRLGNSDGVIIKHSNANVVGGLTPAAANLVGGNTSVGIELLGAANLNEVQGNYIGTDPSSSVLASTEFGNGDHGVHVHGRAHDNLIGGTSPGAGNVINNNGDALQEKGSGILIAGAFENRIQGNYIGFDPDGTYATDFVGNGQFGVIFDGERNIFGGSGSGAGNTIGWNGSGGLYTNGLFQGIQGNTFKRSPSSSDPASTNPVAIIVGSDSEGVVIGGRGVGKGNLIEDSYISGITVEPEAKDTTILGNGISSQGNGGGVAIDLFTKKAPDTRGVTPNDAKDADPKLQNFPVLASATRADADVTIAGALNTSPGTFTVEFFASQACSTTGNGPGEHFIGRKTVTTAANGTANISIVLDGNPAFGSFVTATATAFDTSEFSNCVPIAP